MSWQILGYCLVRTISRYLACFLPCMWMTKSGWNGELPFIDAASVYTLGEVEPLPLPRTCMYVRYSTLGKRTSGVQDKRTGVCIWKGKVIANSLQTHCKVWSGDWGGDQHAWYFWSKEWGNERTQWYQGWDLIVLQIEEIGPLHSGKGSLTSKLTVVLWWRSEEWGVNLWLPRCLIDVRDISINWLMPQQQREGL